MQRVNRNERIDVEIPQRPIIHQPPKKIQPNKVICWADFESQRTSIIPPPFNDRKQWLWVEEEKSWIVTNILLRQTQQVQVGYQYSILNCFLNKQGGNQDFCLTFRLEMPTSRNFIINGAISKLNNAKKLVSIWMLV